MSSKYKILRSRKVDPIPAHWNGRSQTMLSTVKIHSAGIGEMWQHNNQGTYVSFYDEKKWIKVSKEISNRILKDTKYLPTIYKKQKNAGKKLIALSCKINKIDLKKVSFEKLASFYMQLENAWVRHDQYNVTPWFIGGDHFYSYLKNRLSDVYGVLVEDIDILLIPPKLSFSAKEEFEIYNISLDIKVGSFDIKKVSNLVDRFYWISFGYDGPSVYDKEHYLRTLEEIVNKKDLEFIKNKITEIGQFEKKLRERQSAIFQKYKIPVDVRELAKTAHILALMTDERKEYTFPSHVVFDKVIKAMANKIGVDYTTFKYLMLDEIKKYRKKPEVLTKLFHLRMNNAFIIYWKKGKYKIIEGVKVKKLETEVMDKVKTVTEFKGQAVSRTANQKISGKVKVVLSPGEMSKLDEGEILVATMTSPEYVPAMRKSLAIITDEGGITCHAAIVARELKKPCIIGTKIATKVLKDGDLIEVDAEKGVVTIIKKVS